MTDWLDGKKLYDWLAAHGFTARDMDPHGSAPAKWRSGQRVSVYTADVVLTRLGLTLHEVPDEMWTKPPPNRLRTDPDLYERVVRLAATTTATETATLCGVSSNTVRRWVAS